MLGSRDDGIDIILSGDRRMKKGGKMMDMLRKSMIMENAVIFADKILRSVKVGE